MKKLFITWGFVAAALTLFSCAKQETIVNDAQPAQAGVPFELVAGVDTKTATTDASTINWVANDALNVFVAEHNSAFGANKQFTTADGTSTFSGVLESALDGAKTYDWKVFYPYNEDILTVSTHNGTKGYLTLGSKTNATQTQAGNNNKAHLAGSHMPLYGVGNGVAGDGTPNISLTQVMSVVEVKVTNKTDSPLVVSSVDFTAPAGTLISGTFFLDFSGNTPDFTSSGPSYTSNVAKLTVSDGAAIAKDGLARFYIAVKPFTVSSGTITVAVNGYEKEITISSETTFASGKIKTVNFDYDYTNTKVEPTSKTGWYRVENASWLAAGDRVVIAANESNVALSTTQNSNNRGAKTISKGTDGDYSTLTSNDDVQMFILEDGTVDDSFAFKTDNGSTSGKYIYAASSDSNHLKTQDEKDANASFSIAIDASGSASIVAQGTNSRNVLQYNAGSSLFSCYGSASQGAVAIYKHYGPEIVVTSDNPMNVANTASSQEIAYSIANPVLGRNISAATSVAWISNISTSTSGKVTFDVAAQESGASSRSANITLSYEDAIDVVVTVNQAAGAGASDKTYTITWNSNNNSKAVSGYEDTWSVTAGGLTCTMKNFNNNNNGWEYVKCGRKNNASVATIITSTAIPEAIKTVTITIDALTASKINSVKLYVSDTSTFGTTAAASFTKATGDQSVTITSPAANKYYKLEFNCASGSSNGLLTLSKLVFSTK